MIPALFDKMIAAMALTFVTSMPATAAAVITTGPYVPSATSPFVVPIVVTGAIDYASWTFDLAWNPSDFAVDTACDPFAGNAYCDALTGPITAGTFYAGATFPALFVPGFVLLAGSGAQTGLLIGVNGAWQDVLAPPSGDGILAFVQFVPRSGGSGLSPITVVDLPNVIPEPAPIALIVAAFAVATLRRRTTAT